MNLTPPTTDFTTVTIAAPVVPAPIEIDLPDGVVGMEYEYELGDRANRYRKTRGRLDSGLKISRNLLKGIPEKEGKYRFLVQSTDPHGTDTETWYNLKIKKALLTVTTTPQKIALDRNRAGTFRLAYHFKSSEPLNDTLSSTQGIFLAGSRKLGIINTKISTKMTKGTAQLTEQVKIPFDIIKTAQRMGIKNIRYQRTFTPRYMDAATTGSTAITVGTGFTFTKIRITFLDHTSKRFVKRNEKIDGAMVELRYEGAGLLKGYWQADDRILARVTKNLPFANARTITLKLPKVPLLPTHSTGSHRLRFVITNPVMNIPFPQVIYIVTGEDLSKAHPLHLLSPVNDETVSTDKLSFSWKPGHGTALYHLELFEGKGKEQTVLFSAFSKEPSYTIPTSIFRKKFHQDTEYFWRVTGLDKNDKPIARSKQRSFRLGPDSLTYVSGRLLMLIDDTNNSAILDTLAKKYHLTLIEKKHLPGLGRDLLFFSTTNMENIEELSRRLMTENSGITAQPDYYYSTLGTVIEEQNRQTVLQFLKLKTTPSGKNVRVAIIDTGVDLNHDDLASNIIAHANYIKKTPYRAELHGTAVAGIIGAVLNGKGNAGIAPESKLIALRACEQRQPDKADGRCYSSSIIQAIDGAIANKARVINMSLGTSAPDHLVSSALDIAVNSGGIVLAPAGNDRHQKKLAFPASHPKVISVAGILDNGRKIPNDMVADQADCFLPAQYVQVTLPGNRTSFMHGTSMASAEMAGMLADFLPNPALLIQCQSADNLLRCIAAANNNPGKY
jgi:hypothetical protein